MCYKVAEQPDPTTRWGWTSEYVREGVKNASKITSEMHLQAKLVSMNFSSGTPTNRHWHQKKQAHQRSVNP